MQRDEYFYKILKFSKVLLEERIIQDQEFSSFNDSSVNTVRVCTFNTKDGIVPAYGFFRTGRNGSFVDNAATGKFLRQWIFFSDVFRLMAVMNMEMFIYHSQKQGEHSKTLYFQSGMKLFLSA